MWMSIALGSLFLALLIIGAIMYWTTRVDPAIQRRADVRRQQWLAEQQMQAIVQDTIQRMVREARRHG